jgi:hypothetical protein
MVAHSSINILDIEFESHPSLQLRSLVALLAKLSRDARKYR